MGGIFARRRELGTLLSAAWLIFRVTNGPLAGKAKACQD